MRLIINVLVEKYVHISETFRFFFFLSVSTFIFKIILSLNAFFTVLFSVITTLTCLFIDWYIVRCYYCSPVESFKDIEENDINKDNFDN